jgi:hypothetical protein
MSQGPVTSRQTNPDARLLSAGQLPLPSQFSATSQGPAFARLRSVGVSAIATTIIIDRSITILVVQRREHRRDKRPHCQYKTYHDRSKNAHDRKNKKLTRQRRKSLQRRDKRPTVVEMNRLGTSACHQYTPIDDTCLSNVCINQRSRNNTTFFTSRISHPPGASARQTLPAAAKPSAGHLSVLPSHFYSAT